MDWLKESFHFLTGLQDGDNCKSELVTDEGGRRWRHPRPLSYVQG